MGSGTGVIDTEPVIKASALCNILGLDTISTGVVIQWAMECYERGVLTKADTEGIELTFGNADALLRLIPMIAQRKGKIGNLLAEGVKSASEKIGRDSWKWAMANSKGLEQSGVELRSQKGYSLAFATNMRGPDHLWALPSAERGASPEAVKLIEEITGDKKWATPYVTDHRAEIVRWHEDNYCVAEALGLCVLLIRYALTSSDLAEMFSAATGMNVSGDEIMFKARRIINLEKCCNVRLGADRRLDDLPWRVTHDPLPTGPAKGMVTTQEELDLMLDEYYDLHGCDKKTSWPYKETLDMLQLEEVEAELRSLGKLPQKR